MRGGRQRGGVVVVVDVLVVVVVDGELYEGDVDSLTGVHRQLPRKQFAAALVGVGRTNSQSAIVSAERYLTVCRVVVGHYRNTNKKLCTSMLSSSYCVKVLSVTWHSVLLIVYLLSPPMNRVSIRLDCAEFYLMYAVLPF